MQKYRSTMPMLLGLCLVGSTLAATPASAALGPTGTVFDGDYTGVMNLSRQSRNQRGDSIVRRCQSCREPDDGVAHGAL